MNDTTFEEARAIAAVEMPLPAYMHEVYDWAYVNPRCVHLLDRDVVVHALLFGNARRLMRSYLARLRPGMRVWQLAHVYGGLVSEVAQRIGPRGALLLTDVTPIQISRAQAKLRAHPAAHIVRADAALHAPGETFDVVCSFFLLHEVPDALKHQIVDNALAHLGEEGEALFVDYHRPARWQPVGWLLRLVNRWLEPFAETLWRREIASFARHTGDFVWEKRCLFGGVYQVVSAKKKKPA